MAHFIVAVVVVVVAAVVDVVVVDVVVVVVSTIIMNDCHLYRFSCHHHPRHPFDSSKPS